MSMFPEGSTPKNNDRAAIAMLKILELFKGAIDSNGFLRITGSAINFNDLGDTPKDYATNAGLFLRVNATEDGLEFAAVGGGSFIPTSEKGAANGVATLGADSKLTGSQIPSALLGDMKFMGFWNADANTTNPNLGGLVSGTPSDKGQFWVVDVPGATSIGGITDWKLGDWVVSLGASWGKIDNTDAVVTVAGKTGAVKLNLDDLEDVTVPLPTIGDVLTWNGTAWVNEAPSIPALPTLDGLSDVAIDTPILGQTIIYNGSSWVNGDSFGQFNEQVGTTYTLALTDAGKAVRCTNAAAIALSIPDNATVPFPIGTEIEICQGGAGKVTVGGAGVTIECAVANKRTTTQYAGASLKKRSTDTWWLEGRLE